MPSPFADFELELGAAAAEQVVAHPWGRAILSPGLPLVWDVNRIAVEGHGLAPAAVVAAADEALDGFGHRTVLVADAAEGRRLAPAFGEPWSVERILYMAWEEESGRVAAPRSRRLPWPAARTCAGG